MSEFNTAVTASPRRRLALAVAAAVLPLMVSACASDKNIDLASYAETVEPANELYNQGLANLDAGRMGEAAKKFEAVDRQHPYSEPARKALLMSAFTNYRSAKYEEAITAGQRYVSLYPTSEDAAYAQYLIGLSYFRQIRDVTQDQKEARRTAEAMRELIERWPESEYVDDAHAKIRYARDQLAGKEMQVGRYYLERREYVGAIKRFRNVVEMYSDTRHVEEALARLAETYLAMGLASEAQAAAAVLGHNYPDSQWYKDTYKLLQSGGLEPRENKGSWLSGVGKLLGAKES
ncbi:MULTISPECIES: outer membrane protein assembly factor BamD [unclassified Aminobacter]|uniref:outer membrane protein assembly factor BamD n=1 Tax=unclassified Aminobacter TaxID=2644704 RepID=UPI0004B1BFAE|nr:MULTISPECIES: outer membrane protein assembly factor BamD [unclassified Aminobacter]TWG64783.1 Beta-barrel assembly machine subunit BamD [Aminobacter sp. J44]TWH36713.1 Beta-barrel assembly machine subunit BamD [Aminobacter sp. J15]